jgi:hypothetical protein
MLFARLPSSISSKWGSVGSTRTIILLAKSISRRSNLLCQSRCKCDTKQSIYHQVRIACEIDARRRHLSTSVLATDGPHPYPRHRQPILRVAHLHGRGLQGRRLDHHRQNLPDAAQFHFEILIGTCCTLPPPMGRTMRYPVRPQ